MYSDPWAKLTTVRRPKMSDSPIASSTKIIPSTRPVKTCATSADAVMSITRLDLSLSKTLFAAGAVVFFVGRDPAHDVVDAPLPLELVPALDDPHVLHGLVVAGAPPLLALVVVVGRVLPERVGHLVGFGRLGELRAAGDFEAAAVGIAAIVAGRHVEFLLERLDVALGLRDRILKLPVEVDPGIDVGVGVGAALLAVREPVQGLGDLHLLLHAEADGCLLYTSDAADE